MANKTKRLKNSSEGDKKSREIHQRLISSIEERQGAQELPYSRGPSLSKMKTSREAESRKQRLGGQTCWFPTLPFNITLFNFLFSAKI